MIPTDFKSCIILLLEKEVSNLENYKNTWKIENKRIIYENSQTLIDLYYNNPEKNLREIFINCLDLSISKDEEKDISTYIYDTNEVDEYYFVSNSALSFFTFIKLGLIEQALDALQARKNDNSCILIIELLLDIFRDNSAYFDISVLHKLIEILNAKAFYNNHASTCRRLVKEAITTNAYDLIKKQIQGVNIEINRDTQTVVKIIKYFKFDEKYNNFLNELDTYINTQSGLVASGMISNFRTFMQDLLIDLAKGISRITSEDIPKAAKTPIGNARIYLKRKLGLTDNDHKFIDSFIDILHGEGGHSFMANVEYFRLARNIGIEIALLLLTKYERLFKPAEAEEVELFPDTF